MKKITLLILIGLSFFSSCSAELTRDKAEEIVRQEFQYPNLETVKFGLDILGSNRYQPLYNLGLLYKPRGLAMSVGVTSEGIKYTPDRKNPGDYSCFFITSVREFNAITGIAFQNEDKSKAIVEFNIKRTYITPFGEFLQYSIGDIVSYSVEFVKYDDGWRIVNQENNTNLSPNNFKDILK